MPTVWLTLKKSLQCKSEPSDVYDPKRKSAFPSSSKIGRSGCSRSIANLRDVVIHGSKRHLDRPPSCSPRSIGSSEFINPISHDVFINSSTCELRISGFHGDHVRSRSPMPPAAPVRPAKKPAFLMGSSDSSLRCHKCGEKFGKWEILETHHLSKHAGSSSSSLSSLSPPTFYLLFLSLLSFPSRVRFPTQHHSKLAKSSSSSPPNYLSHRDLPSLQARRFLVCFSTEELCPSVSLPTFSLIETHRLSKRSSQLFVFFAPLFLSLFSLSSTPNTFPGAGVLHSIRAYLFLCNHLFNRASSSNSSPLFFSLHSLCPSPFLSTFY